MPLSLSRRAEIAMAATTSADGTPDGNPTNVYNRLVLAGFWAQTA